MPEIRVVKERLNYLTCLFPGAGQTQIIQRSEIHRLFAGTFRNERDLDSATQSLISIISMLGFGAGLDSVRSDWVGLRVYRAEKLTEILSDLPAGPSRRRMVLEWIRQRSKSESEKRVDLRVAFSLLDISDDLRISAAGIFEVLRYYSDLKQLEFKLVPQAEGRNHVLVSGDVGEVYASLPKYQRWRLALQQSLQALSAFVTEDRCRITQAETLFFSRSGARTLSNEQFCGRCDLCLSRDRGQSTPPIVPVATSLTLSSSEHLR